ncbi:MAG: 5'-nucleotidase C-terminal domain-containing protein, partial [bacterium]|nr:5'-nucleotidase C-terminal domain-containing protein [bacterium]
MINSVSNQNLNYSAANTPSLPKKRTQLSIFYINDMHGNIDNMSGMLAASDKFDRETANTGIDTLKISAGDNFSGGDDAKNQLIINLLSRMGINASAVGNHEFDSTISTFYKFLSPEKTKFLAANAKTPEGSEFYNNVQKSTVVEVNGNKYGLVGLLPFDLETVTGADERKLEGIRPETVDKSIEIVNDEVRKLQNQNVDKIILVSHIGNDKDKEIASKLHGVDIIVGGHSHTEVKGIEQNENLFKNADGDPVLIVQTGENSKNVGVLNVEFDENGIPVRAQNNLIKTTQSKSPVLNYLKDATMGKSPEVASLMECDPLPANRRITPCAWTNLMCDAMRSETNTDIAFINAANTRKAPKAGILTERDVMESTPLKNTLLVKQMTEKEVVRAIKDALQMSFSNETGEPGILHTSGLSYTADTKGNLIEMSFVDRNGNKTPIDINNPSDKTYSVCYDSFVAKGTEYPVFVPETSTHKEIQQTFDF